MWVALKEPVVMRLRFVAMSTMPVSLNFSYAFQQCKNGENRLRFDRVTESLKAETF